jgi:hypothetical protein
MVVSTRTCVQGIPDLVLAAEIAPTSFRAKDVLAVLPVVVLSTLLELLFSFLNGEYKLDDGRLTLGFENGEVIEVVLKAAKPALQVIRGQ